MSNNAINVRQVFRDSNGNPRAEGYVYFYENKTTTLASIYSDELLTVAQSNPYQLNANGEITGNVKYSGKCTVTHTNKDGSDPISDDDVESQGGSAYDAFVDQFKVVETIPASMAVIVTSGKVMNGETLVSIANQTTTAITAPTSNPRIDRIVVDKLTGVYTIVAGSEAASPTAPAIPTGKAPCAQILLQTSTTSIVEAIITDERISGSIEPSNINSTETLSNKTIGDTNTINAQDDAFVIQGAGDHTKQIGFSSIGNPSTKTILTFVQSVNTTITFPDASDTLVGKATTDTLTNKTLGDTNTINAQDDAFTIDDAADATKQIDFDAAGTTGTKTTIASSQTANRTVTIPDATDTLVGKATTDTLTNKSVDLTNNTLTGTTAQFNTALSDDDFATLTNSVTLTNKTIGDTNTINAQDDAFTIDDAADATKQIDFDAAGTTGTKTTIASSQTANRIVTIPDATDTLVGKATTDTLTNKTIDLSNNTIVDIFIDSASPYVTAIGRNALASNTTGASNTAVGYSALTTNTIGINDTAVGYQSLTANTTGINNTAIGYRSLFSNTTGNSNIAIGSIALQSNTIGSDNIAIGYGSLSSNTTGNSNTAIGGSTLSANTIGTSNTAIGYTSLQSNTTGIQNTAVGEGALFINTIGYSNIAIGYNSLRLNTTGAENSAIGHSSLYSNTIGIGNVAVGYHALYSNTTGNSNTAIGYNSVATNTTAGNNTGVGYATLQSSTGANCTAVGSTALQSCTTGASNSAFGTTSLQSNTTGTNNTGIGYSAGSNITTGTNLTCLGYNAQPTSATATNEITLGDALVGTLRCATTTITAISDKRDKKNIVDIPLGLEFIDAIRPVRFDWNMRNGGKIDIPEAGFIAQDLLQASIDFDAKWVGLVLEENTDRLEASPGKLIPIMVKAIQELSKKVADLESK